MKAASDFKYLFTVPAGTVVSGVAPDLDQVTYSAGTPAQVVEVDLTVSRSITTTIDGTFLWSPAAAIVVVSGTAGTIQLQWAQVTAVAENTVVKKGSMIRATKLI